jgi:hypothetical protein
MSRWASACIVARSEALMEDRLAYARPVVVGKTNFNGWGV